ncbi:unnamed protein product [Notodromas monacha]|uniref:Uncharacterized protein n=1 Tax=Notodromas monacha TaxID=399045 RepID=A0A7R9BU20_9CRUS|nr:unnamed protein product [Notodromas monacha]CAG0920691.1 unnamed protein product [Notodromas monacha]
MASSILGGFVSFLIVSFVSYNANAGMALVQDEKPEMRDIQKHTIVPGNTHEMILHHLKNVRPTPVRELGETLNMKSASDGQNGHTTGMMHSFPKSDSTAGSSTKGSEFPQELMNGNVNFAQFIDPQTSTTPAPQPEMIQPPEKSSREILEDTSSTLNSKIKGTYEARLYPEKLFDFSDDIRRSFSENGVKRRRRHVSQAGTVSDMEGIPDKSQFSYTWRSRELPVRAFVINLKKDGNEGERGIQDLEHPVPEANENTKNLKTFQTESSLPTAEEDTQINHTNIVIKHDGIPRLSLEKVNIEFSIPSLGHHRQDLGTTLLRPIEENVQQMSRFLRKRKTATKRFKRVKKLRNLIRDKRSDDEEEDEDMPANCEEAFDPCACFRKKHAPKD